VSEGRRRDLCELFAAVTLAAAFRHPAPDALPAPDPGDGASTHEVGAVCPRCFRPLRFEDDPMTGLVYEACACGYAALLSRAAAETRYREDQRRLARACRSFKAPAQHQGVRRVAATCSLAA